MKTGDCLTGMVANKCDPNLNAARYQTTRQCRGAGKTWKYPITTWVASTGGK